MTALMDHPTLTQAAPPRPAEEQRRRYPATLVMVVGISAATSFTLSSPPAAEAAPVVTTVPASTALGAHLAPTRERGVAAQVRALKMDSGLTWAQFAGLFGVTPRAVHFWVEGGRLSDDHIDRLERVRQVISSIDAATPAAAREALFSIAPQGRTTYSLLVAELEPSSSRAAFDSSPLGFEEFESGVGAPGEPVAPEDMPGIKLRSW